ncbi:MAG: hypothetical protein ACTSWW_06745 [Promethearchaeota archaeon]
MKTVSLEKIIALARKDPAVQQLIADFPDAEILTHSLSEAQTTQMKAEYPTVFSELTKEAFCVNVISTEMVLPKGYRKIRFYFSSDGVLLKKIIA